MASQYSPTGPNLPGQAVAPQQEDFSRAGGRPSLPNGPTVSCPMICALLPNGFTPLPVSRLTVNARCQISMGFVTMEMACTYPKEWASAPLQLYVPKTQSTVITELHIDNVTRNKVFATTVIPAEDAEENGFGSSAPYESQGQAPQPTNADDPELFVLGLPPANAGDEMVMVLNYFLPLTFENGAYMLRLPVELSPQCSPTTDVIDATVTIQTGMEAKVDFCVLSSHTPTQGLDQPGITTISFGTGPASLLMPNGTTARQPNADIEVGYYVWSDDMHMSLNLSPPADQPTTERPDPRGSFCIAVAPPKPDKVKAYPRSIIFVLDCSGSMAGEPMLYARSAVLFGLRQLGPMDFFNVVAFDHEQRWFATEVTPANREALSAAETWLNGILARGLTDIMTPIMDALGMLSQQYAKLQAEGGVMALPFIFLLTDGCVENEREICMAVEQQLGANQAQAFSNIKGGLPRVSTFAIGPYCNHFFLRQLATFGRGLHDAAFRPYAIKTQMERMLVAAQRPVLSDVTLSVAGVNSLELYPYPLPDLFCGQPLLIAGKYEGNWPENGVYVKGRLPDGSTWTSAPIQPSKDTGLPLDPIFIKSRLDLMTAQAWLQGNPPDLVQAIVDLSVRSGVPCAHTRTIGFEMTRENYVKWQEQRDEDGGNGKNDYLLYAIGGAAAILVIGGVIAALAFGDAAATAANAGDATAGVADAGAAGADGGGEGGECCGDCECDCCDGCDCEDACEAAAGGCTIS